VINQVEDALIEAIDIRAARKRAPRSRLQRLLVVQHEEPGVSFDEMRIYVGRRQVFVFESRPAPIRRRGGVR